MPVWYVACGQPRCARMGEPWADAGLGWDGYPRDILGNCEGTTPQCHDVSQEITGLGLQESSCDTK